MLYGLLLWMLPGTQNVPVPVCPVILTGAVEPYCVSTSQRDGGTPVEGTTDMGPFEFPPLTIRETLCDPI
jgi:hypothetical protein